MSITKAEDAYDFLRLKRGVIGHDVFVIIWLDNQHCVIEFEELFIDIPLMEPVWLEC